MEGCGLPITPAASASVNFSNTLPQTAFVKIRFDRFLLIFVCSFVSSVCLFVCLRGVVLFVCVLFLGSNASFIVGFSKTEIDFELFVRHSFVFLFRHVCKCAHCV